MTDIDMGPGGPDSTQNDEQVPPGAVTPDSNSDPVETKPDGIADKPEFDAVAAADTIQKLRKENADARVKAKETEALARKVHTALVAGTGKLVDPEVLPFDAEHLADADKLNAAIDALVEAKPYLRVRPTGDVGQGQRGSSDAKPTWADLFKGA